MPSGSEPELMVSVAPAALIKILSGSVAVEPPASFTCAVDVKLAAAVGVPEMTPAVESDSPDGREPETRLHVYGAMPPLACKVAT